VPFPTRDELTLAWGDHVLARLSSKARVRFQAGHFIAADDEVGVFSLPNAIHRDRCQDLRPEVEAALAAHFGRPVRLRLVVEQAAVPTEAPALPDDESVDLDDLQDAPAAELRSPLDHVLQAFEGATVVEE
jgi:hypothetical protein